MGLAKCGSCDTPLPEGALYCAACGAATPTSVSAESSGSALGSLDEAAFQRRLQKAVGDAFEIQRLLGFGGFGAVFAARDVKLQRDVAIKVLRPELLASRETLERFEREARAVAQLRHPNIVPVYQVGEGQGLAWFVMPLVEGETLRAALNREERLPIDEVRRILSEAADGLQVAHERGLVHRDIKPENIMLEGRGRRVLLMDFGIAKALGDPQTGLTGTGMIIGTPQYMSPEQAAAEKNLDHRSDQYSLALLGYRMLAGADLFEGDSLPSIIRKQIVAEPPDLRRQAPGTPPEMSQAIARALASDPDERFPDMEAFAKALIPRDARQAARSDGIDEVALARDMPVSRPLLIAGLVGLVVFLAGYRAAYRPVFAPLGISKDSAWVVGRAFFADQGAAGSFREAADYSSDSGNGNRYLVERLGRDEARRWADQYLPRARWRLRWFRPGEQEEWRVAVAAGARIESFEHVIADAAPGAQLESDSAQALAAAFLSAQGWSTDGMQLTAANSQQRSARRDHDFTWLQPFPLRSGESGAERSRGGLQLEVSVRGDRVGRLSARVLVPDNVRRGYEAQSTARSVRVIVLVLAALAITIAIIVTQARARRLRWRTAVRVAAVLLLLTYVSTANTNRVNAVMQYDTSQSWMTYQALQFVVEFFGAAFVSGVGLVLLASVEAFGRASLPSALRGYREITSGRWSTAPVRCELRNGLGVAGVLLGLVVLVRLAMRLVPGAAELTVDGAPGPVAGLVPALAVIGALGDALILPPVVALGVLAARRVTRSTMPAALLCAIVIAALVPEGVSPYGLGVALQAMTVAGLALGFVYAGWLGLAAGVFVKESVTSGVGLLFGGVPGYTAVAVILILAAGLPLIPLVAGWNSRRST